MPFNSLSNKIKIEAKRIGFSKIGFAKAQILNHDVSNLNYWLSHQYHGSMHWIEGRKAERLNVNTYYPNAKSIISVAINYFTGYAHDYFNDYKISNYAWGDDYHLLMKSKLKELLKGIKNIDNNIEGICCVDTSPISEKVWAQQAGLGWIGKHTNLITREFGSWVFLGELVVNCELDYDEPFGDDLCGSCTACIDACPTDAIIAEYQLDANKCISYQTIENRNAIPEQFSNKMDKWIYGCDICQEVCPWSDKFSLISNENSFQPRKFLIENDIHYLYNLSSDRYSRLFKNSAMKRTKFKGLKRNIDFIR